MDAFYSDGDVSLYNGDACDVLPSLGVEANLILTSPPYGEIRNYGGHTFDWQAMMTTCAAALMPGGVMVWIVADGIIDGSETGISFRQALYAKDELGLRLHDTMIYEMLYATNPTSSRYSQAFNYTFVFSRGKPNTVHLIADVPNKYAGTTALKHYSPGSPRDGSNQSKYAPHTIPSHRKRGNVWLYDAGYNKNAPDFPDAHKHPAIFPLALAKDHIRSWTNPGDIVIDPMAGSGTTLRSAKDLNRRSIGIEIHRPYCELAMQRLGQGVLPIANA